MNNYDFDYMNYMTNIPFNMASNLNYLEDNKKTISQNNSYNNSNTNNILNPKEGFIRGNLFSDLYNQYKNYKPQNINPTTERSALLNQWQQYNFAIIELNLYLDTHPNNTKALNLLNNYNNILKQITKKYESMYGPLTIECAPNTNNFIWINSPWPWEVDNNV